MADTQLVTDFLVGKDEVSKKLDEQVAEMEKNQKAFGKMSENAKLFDNQVKALSSEFSNMSGILNAMQEAGHMKALGVDVTKNEAYIRRLGKQAGLTGSALDDAFEKGRISAQRFDMSLLSVMFTGMIVSNMISGMNRALISTYMKAEEDTNGLQDATNRLGAAWEFFKFSLFDALNTPFFIGIIDGVIKVINGLSQMSDWVKIAILGTTTGLGALAMGGFIYSQIKLFTDAVFAPGGMLNKGPKEAADAIDDVANSLDDTTNKFLNLKNIVGAGLIIYATFKTVDALTSKEQTSLGDMLKASLSAGLGVGLLFGVAPGIIAAGTVLITIMAKDDMNTNLERIKKAWETPAWLRSGEQAVATGYSGTGVPLEVQQQKAIWNFQNLGYSAKEASASVDLYSLSDSRLSTNMDTTNQKIGATIVALPLVAQGHYDAASAKHADAEAQERLNRALDGATENTGNTQVSSTDMPLDQPIYQSGNYGQATRTANYYKYRSTDG